MSIKKIKETYKITDKFHLKEVSPEEVKKVIKSLNKKKSAISSCIPVKVLIDSVDTYLPIFTDIVNSSVRNGTFSEDLFNKVNYRSVSLLSHVLKVYERIIFSQISTYFQPYFSNFLTGFRQNDNRQHSLLKMLELWKEALDKDKSVGAIFMDLCKAFDTLNHDLLIAKLEGCGFSEKFLNYIQSYLRNRLQRANVNNNFSQWKDIFAGAPQESVLNNNFSQWKDIFAGAPQGSVRGPLMYNIYINDKFLSPDNVCLSNYADDTTLYSTGENHNTNRNILNKNLLSLQK